MAVKSVLKAGETPHDYRIRLAPEELNLFKERHVQHLLEVCCGDGTNLIALSKKGYALIGIESNPQLLSRALQNVREAHVSVKVMDHPIYGAAFPFADDSFDVVYSYQYLNHNFLDAIRAVFKEIYRVLKNGGIFSLKITDIEQFNLRHIRGDMYEECDPEFPKIKYRMLAPQTFAKLEGDEVGIPHYGFRLAELLSVLEGVGFKLLNARTIRWNHVVNVYK